MIWGQIIWFVVTLVASIALAPKPPKPRSASIDDFEFPTAEEGRPVPVVFGTVRVTGANVLWYGDLGRQAIKQKSMFSSTTVGYKYFVGIHFGICHGPVDAVTKIEIGDKQAWTGSVTANSSIDINQGDLFGGKKREGGIIGTVDMCFGAPTQTVNTYLNSKVGSPTPAFRGITGFVFHNTVANQTSSGKSGGYIGTTNYPKPWAFTVRRITKGWVGDSPWYSAKAAIGTSMNPAHIIRQCLTDPEWGMGQPTTSFDSSWESAADQFFTEGFGLDLLWNQQTSIEEFVQVVLDHVGGLIRLNRSTGKLGIRLIRDDYTPASLSLFNENTIREIKKYQRQAWGETVNEITLTYTDATTRKTTGITVQDLGNIRSQGARVAERVDMPGITSQTIAAKAAARELAARSTPLSTISFDINRNFWQHSPGDVFRLSWDALGIGEVVFRVIKSKPGALSDGMIEVEAVEDIYGLPSATYTSIVGPGSAAPDDTTPDPDDQGGGSIISATITTPPASPTDGATYFVPTGATGVWATHVGQIATYSADDGTWSYTTPAPGTVVYNEATSTHTDVSGGTATPAPWVAGKVAWVADITPAALAADENNYAPTGLSGASTLRLSATGGTRTITGLTGGEDGRILLLHNIGTQNLILKDESASSTAANRFALSADVTLTPDQSVMVQYDTTASRWRVVGGTAASGGGSGGTSGGNGGLSFVGKATVTGSAATSLTLTGLDLDAHGEYLVEVALSNATASLCTVKLTYNSDTTDANYYYQATGANNSSVYAGRANNAHIGEMMAVSGSAFTCIAKLRRTNGGRVQFYADVAQGSWSDSRNFLINHTWTTTGVNITSLTITSTVASTLAVGSTIRVWRLAETGDLNAAMNPPLASAFTWVNQAAATLTDKVGRLVMSIPSAGGLRCILTTPPATPFTVTAAFHISQPGTNSTSSVAGLVLRNSTSGSIRAIYLVTDGSASRINVTSWSNATTFTANVYAPSLHTPSGVLWLRITDDGTNRVFYCSPNGKDWSQFYTEGRTVYITPDQVGICGYNNMTGHTYKLPILHYSVANSILGDEA